MKVAVFSPEGLPHSSRIYMENVIRELTDLGHTAVPFTDGPVPSADVYWEPSAGRNGPHPVIEQTSVPTAVTFHGAANLALPLTQCYGPGIQARWHGYQLRRETLRAWRRRSRYCDAVITVSEYAKKEAETCLHIPGRLITPIHHGVDLEMFRPRDGGESKGPYFLHISAYQPKKNLERMIAAYHALPPRQRPRLIIVSPGYRPKSYDQGVEWICQSMDHPQIVSLYQNALGFIFPSLHETFGMPIIEAMACGCPVLTSNHAGCVEVAGDAALIVDPYSVDSIANAMNKLIDDDELRQKLRGKGIERAREFTWRRSAEKHLAVFERISSGGV